MKNGITTYTFVAPAHWASGLINGDTSGLSEGDATEFEQWVDTHPTEASEVVSCDGEPYLARWNGLLTDLLEYTALHDDPELDMSESVDDCYQKHGERHVIRPLATFADGGYPLVYLTERDEPLCQACATSQESGEPVRFGVRWEGEPIECAGCNTDIPSAYGIPEQSTE